MRQHYTVAVEHGEAASYAYVVAPCAGIVASVRLDGDPAGLARARVLAAGASRAWDDGEPCRGCGGDCCDDDI